MMRYLLFSLALVMSVGLSAQTESYWILLSDKSNTPYSIDTPEGFLSQRAILRRTNQGYPIDQRDLPVDPAYITALAEIDELDIKYTSRWFNAIAVDCSQSALVQAELLPFVAQVKSASTLISELPEIALEYPHHSELASTRLPIDYGLSRNQIEDLNGQFLHEEGYEGQGMEIAILDSGFDHVDSMAAFLDLRSTGRIISTRDFVDGDLEVYDAHNHGRYVLGCMAGIIEDEAYGTATQASYHLLRTEDVATETRVEEYNWIAAAEYADSIGVDVINTSLGYTTFDDPDEDYSYADMDGNTTWITQAADIAASRGILVVSSAGNSGASAWHFIGAPADADSSLAVGSIDADSTHSSFSSFGPSADGRVKPNVCAQGRQSASIDRNDNVVLINGTSFSSPILAGLAASLWQSVPTADNMDVLRAIEESAHLHSSPNDSLGYGIPDFGLAMNILAAMVSSIDETSADYARLYPNPSAGDSYLQLRSTWLGASPQIKLYDMQGRAVDVLLTSVGQELYKISSAGFDAGTYLLQISGVQGHEELLFIKE